MFLKMMVSLSVILGVSGSAFAACCGSPCCKTTCASTNSCANQCGECGTKKGKVKAEEAECAQNAEPAQEAIQKEAVVESTH